jgi:hypothetical protein
MGRSLLSVLNEGRGGRVMKRCAFIIVIQFLFLSLVNCGTEQTQTPTTPRGVADAYIEAAQSGDVGAVENLSTDDYKKRAENEVGRFQRFGTCTFSESETEDESEGRWHLFNYSCEMEGGGTEEVIVAVLETDGSILVGDID